MAEEGDGQTHRQTAAGALRERIARAGGSVGFEEFMRWALYDPEHGYYSRRVRTVGRTGDFSTAATLGTGLAEAVGAWAAAHRVEVAARGGWHLVELGGGSGGDGGGRAARGRLVGAARAEVSRRRGIRGVADGTAGAARGVEGTPWRGTGRSPGRWTRPAGGR